MGGKVASGPVYCWPVRPVRSIGSCS